MPLSSPQLVLVLDRIRNELEGQDKYREFCWFAREYPRCYRHHLECAKFRLQTIHALYLQIHVELASSVTADPMMVGTSVSDIRSKRVY